MVARELNQIILGLIAIVGSANLAQAESIAAPVMEYQSVEQGGAPLDPYLPPPEAAVVEPSAAEIVDELFLGAVVALCSDGSSDDACTQLLDGYQNAYEVAVAYSPEPLNPLEPRGEPEDNRVDTLEVAVGAYIAYVKEGSLGQMAIDGLNKGILELIKLAAEGTKKAEDLVLKFAADEKAIVLKSLKAVLKTLEAELKKATDEDEKKSLQAQIDLAKKLIAAIEKGPEMKKEE